MTSSFTHIIETLVPLDVDGIVLILSILYLDLDQNSMSWKEIYTYLMHGHFDWKLH